MSICRYFADPGTKPIPGHGETRVRLAGVRAVDTAVLGKLSGTGGRQDTRTCAGQLLYEVDDPAACLTPGVATDSRVRCTQEGEHRGRVNGATA